MSDRYIIFPEPARFIDSYTKEPVLVPNDKGQRVPIPDRTFDWFMHAHILSHLQFSMEVGGYDAAKAAKQIAKAMEKAMDEGKKYFKVSADNWRRLCRTLAAPEAAEANEVYKDKPNTNILAKSCQGMTRPMDNFTAQCFMEHMDAIQNASTEEPEEILATHQRINKAIYEGRAERPSNA